MYNYTLQNNHYIVEIEGSKYLLDTGSPWSFFLKPELRSVVINGQYHQLPYNMMGLDIRATHELVGADIDGFIGMDIIKETSLTFYKNGEMCFGAVNEEGTCLELLNNNYGLIKLNMSCNGVDGALLVDTGARYGYGSEAIFNNNQNIKPFGRIRDYNPRIGHFESDIYRFTANFGPIHKQLELGNSVEVRRDLRATGCSAVANITSLFDEVCVIDFQRNRMIVR